MPKVKKISKTEYGYSCECGINIIFEVDPEDITATVVVVPKCFCCQKTIQEILEPSFNKKNAG